MNTEIDSIQPKLFEASETMVSTYSQASAWFSSETYSGEDSIRAPPLPIPNREVKPYHADGTAKAEE